MSKPKNPLRWPNLNNMQRRLFNFLGVGIFFLHKNFNCYILQFWFCFKYLEGTQCTLQVSWTKCKILSPWLYQNAWAHCSPMRSLCTLWLCVGLTVTQHQMVIGTLKHRVNCPAVSIITGSWRIHRYVLTEAWMTFLEL